MSYHIGVDLGGTFVKFGAVGENGNVLKKDKIPTPLGCDYGATVSAIAKAVNVFRPQAVLIGGGISAEGEALTLPLQKMVDTKILGYGRYAPVAIRAASLGNDAGLVGAAMLAKERK